MSFFMVKLSSCPYPSLYVLRLKTAIFVLKTDIYSSMPTFVMRKNFISKVKFATASSVATLLDHGLFLVLLAAGIYPGLSNLISQFGGMVTNFFFQKKYIFDLKRTASNAFLYSLTFSVIGLLVGSGLVHLMMMIPLLESYPYMSKLTVTGLVFFYNYFTKRFSFEGK